MCFRAIPDQTMSADEVGSYNLHIGEYDPKGGFNGPVT
jgi:hypothetical protein